MASKKLFGTDGVRGIANINLTADLALKLGMAAAHVLAVPGKPLRVLIGRDPRISGTMLESALAAGLCAMGARVELVGVAPTPAVAYLVTHGPYDIGAVISASHNPADDNGIKFFGHNGRKLPDTIETKIESAIEHLSTLELPKGAGVGTTEQHQDPLGQYHDFLCSLLPKSLGGMKIVVDGANGAASDIAPRVLKDLGAEVICNACCPDGININFNCGSTHPNDMLNETLKQGAAVGVAFDGDADRAILSDENGMRVDGDRVMALWSLNEMRQGRLHPAVTVGTVMTNLGMEKLLKDNGIELVRTPVGDRYVSEAMSKHKSLIGGEQSGHLIFSKLSTTGDGLITLLEVLKVMQETGKPLSELAHCYKPWPQRLVNMHVKSNKGWNENKVIVQAIANAEALLIETGRVSVRPSGTEPLLRVMVEAECMNLLEIALAGIVDAVKQQLEGHIHSVTELSDAVSN
ncbi:MAG: phosphoglucosamine mutase [bacterium]